MFLVESGAEDAGDCVLQPVRANALAKLEETAAAARQRRAGVAMVTGVAGTGKTCLLKRARAEFERAEDTVLFATARRDGAAGETVRELFAPLGLTVPEAASSPLLAGAARWALPALLPGTGPASTETREDAEYAVLRGLYRLAVNLMADGPLVVMLDDAHLCEPLALRWVDFLLRRAADHPLLVVLAYDPDAAGSGRQMLTTITGHAAKTTIELGPLSRTEVADFIRAVLGAEPEPQFVRVCSDLSSGLPVSLRTLLTELRERGVRPDAGGARRVAEIGGSVLSGAMPARLAGLPESIRKVAAGIAALGGVEPRTIGALLELSVPAVTAAADVLRRHGLLGADRLEFSHEHAREAVLGELPPSERAALQRRGALLLHDEGYPPEDVARLLVDLPELDKPWMCCLLREAAVDAGRRGEPKLAVRYLERVLRAKPDHVEALIDLATILSDSDSERALSHFLRAIERTPDPMVRAELVVRFKALLLTVRKAAPAFRTLSEVLDTLDGDPGQLPAVDDLRRNAQAVLLGVGLCSRSSARKTLRRARTIVVPDGGTPSGRLVLGMLAATEMLDGGSGEQAAERATAALSGTLNVVHGPLIVAARVLAYAGRPAEALAALDRIVAATGGTDDVRTRCDALAARSSVAAGMGRPAEAAADAWAAMELALGETWPSPRLAFVSLLLNRDEPVRAEAVLAEMRHPEFVPEYHEMLMVQARAKLLLRDVEGALSLLLWCGRSVAETGIRSAMPVPWWFDAALILAGQERRPEALALIEAQEETITRWGTPESIGLGLVARGAANGGRPGLELIVQGVERLAASPARISQLRAEIVLGRALLYSGDDAGARKSLHRAVELAVRCGCLALGASAKGLLVAAGGRTRKHGGGLADLLTAAELRVVERAAARATNREIAEALFVTLRTVETHLSNVYRKLGVSSRVELVPVLRKFSGTERDIEPVAVVAASGKTLGWE
ncbi:MAG TPA: LuxR C-terminal-related transcriptional regulator [Amycolatopsis sp.]|uniref:LuxR C-terminal-related transcriptional regulator n=1 Tax=Amycolatopsis sp. TaxID=37632 RepID=UPI002B48D5FB|nr:LuxR C-terminal-related transcriptional regulator [Amycolatopsis sp.]HKS46927.1 LuxR C-terminal-related transcriptional regulator [Amycolatopsis sp.]